MGVKDVELTFRFNKFADSNQDENCLFDFKIKKKKTTTQIYEIFYW
jgi:hypothetical protein